MTDSTRNLKYKTAESIDVLGTQPQTYGPFMLTEVCCHLHYYYTGTGIGVAQHDAVHQ
ncbi:hypothetical protein [Spirochaeta isovalerica]|uniref:Uncharacterized protein n=1 Tax=Spirochaeta isovalerica TaxID=150 RepID=A0A841RBQ2_9SPIO|nr:hypothetical protein [Spirochaeta isovalerica]MBB6481363.1 hypothetical protein [Spirochaeta isovalerica]